MPLSIHFPTVPAWVIGRHAAVNRNEDLAQRCQRRRLRLRNGAPNPCAAALSSQTSVALFAGNSGQLGFFDRLRRLSVGMHSSFDLGVRKGVAVPCSPCHMIHKNEKENQPCPSAARPRCRLMHSWLKAIPPPSAAALTMPFSLSAAGKTLDLPPVNLRVLPLHQTKNALVIALPHWGGIAFKWHPLWR